MRVPVRRSRPRTHVRFHALGALFLLVGLLAPLAPIAPAVAAQRGDPPPLPAPVQVAAVGSFQTALGCAQDYDPSCPQTQLADDGGGVWSGVLAIPPGDYALRIVATGDQQRSLGAGGDPNGPDLGLSVPADAAGAYIAYNALTGEITAEPVAQRATLVTDLGDQVAMAPARGGGYEVYFDAQPGNYGFQVLFDDQPVAQDAIALDAPSRVYAAVDDQGTLTALDTVDDTTLTVTKLDPAGAPLPGACFAVRDGGDLAGQACDGDDGEDGATTLRFPNGLAPGGYALAEVATPDGQEAADEQRIDLGPGQYAAEAIVAGESAEPATETEEAAPGIEETAEAEENEQPGDEPPSGDQAAAGRLVLRATDDRSGDPLPGACFVLIELGIEACDDDEDGDVVFENVPPGFFTLTQTAAPEGYLGNPDTQVEVGADGARLRVPHGRADEGDGAISPIVPDAAETPEAEATEEPTAEATAETAAQPAGEGALAVSVRDENGGAVPGACFALSPRDGGQGQPIERCDGDDGSDDGELFFDALPAGRYRLDETRTPDGRQPSEAQPVAIEDGQTATLTITSEEGEAQPGTLVILVVDENDAPIGGTCFALESDAANFDNICDQGDDGRLNIPEIPSGEYLVRQLQAAPDREPAADETVVVPPGGTEELTVVNQPAEDAATDTPEAEATEEPTEEPTEQPAEEPTPESAQQPAIQATDSGRVAVLVRNEDGAAVEGACVTLQGAAPLGPVCDGEAGDQNDEPGRILLAEVEPGPSVLRIEAPAGYEPPADQPLVVRAGEAARLEVTLALEATPEPTPEETPEETPADEPGTLIVLTEDEAGQPLGGACYTVANGGQTFGPFCDENGNGDVVLNGVTPGEQTVAQTTAPAGAGEPDETEQTTTLDAAGEETLTFTHGADQEAATGSVLVTLEADGRPVAGACVELTADGDTIGPVCDVGTVASPDWRLPNAQVEPADADPEGGRILIEDVPVGDYALAVVDAPDGFAAPQPEEITVRADETAEAAVALTPEGPDLATIAIQTEGEGGEPLGFACYTLTNQNGTFGPFCDQDGDGTTLITEVGPGEKTIAQSTPPADAGPPQEAEQTVTVEEGEDAELTFEHGPALGAVRISVADPAGDPVAGGCYGLTGPQGYAACDDGDGDADPTPGLVLIDDVEPGDYTVAETETPEGIQPAAAPQTVTVAAGEPTEVAFAATPVAETGGVEATTVDPDGAIVEAQPGACFGLTGASEFAPVCDNEAGDADPAVGVVGIDGVPTGDYVLNQTRAPEGYASAGAVDVAVAADEIAAVAVESAPTAAPTGTLVVVNLGPGGEPLGGGCFSLAGPEAENCDNGPADADPDPGAIAFTGLEAGVYTVTQTTPPDGFAPAEPREVEVVADEEAVAEFESQPVAPETGSVQLAAQDADGSPLEGQCFNLTRDGQGLGTFCDNGDEDSDPDPGQLVLEGLDEGVYEAVAAPAPGDEEPSVAAQAVGGFEQRTFTVRRNQAPVLVVIVLPQIPATTGDLVVGKRDERDRPLAGACFALLDGDDEIAAICDDRGNDGDGNRGQIRFNEVPTGTYTLTESEAPPGYDTAADQEVEIRGGRVTRTRVQDQPLDLTSSLSVVTTDGAGDALAGACYSLLRGARTIGPVCDEADGNDGVTLLADLDGGAYILRQTRAPSPDYAPANDQALLIEAGQDQEVEVVNTPRPGSVLIQKVDEAGQLLGGACFALETDGGGDGYAVCDDDPNDGQPEPGTILIQNVAPGDYLALETRAPAGYRLTGEQSVTVAPNRRADLRFENLPLPPPPRRGNLVVYKVDANDQALPGACFALVQGEETVVGPRCDGADGARDGTIRFDGVGVGDYLLRETVRPSANYEPIGDVPVTVQLNQTTEIAIENRLRPGRVTVRKTDPRGTPLQNACFDLEPDGEGPLCTDDAGLATFRALPPGTYRLTETQAPAGYLEAAPVEGIQVNPGATTTVDVVDEPAPPPPDTGSIQVIKFYCPAGDEGEGTAFVDSSDPGGARLAQTANCGPGDATFRLIAATGEGGPGDFAVGADGRYQTTLLAGDYDLTELAPDLPGDATEPVTIYVNQLTTVVVLNYVAPPAPAPAAIDVVKYTCAPGFQGTVFADFVDVCAADANLTNNVTFRLAGTLAGRRVTGDGGRQGQTTFAELPAGDYVLREQPPAPAQTVYAFCGLDPNAPNLRGVGTLNPSLAFRLDAGQRLTCYWFNVPDELSETTGALVVHKLGCAVERPPTGYDWYQECDPQGAGVRFSLAVQDGAEFVPVGTAATDGDGLVRFLRLEPGTYQLTEVGAAWCHAESDSVNARGEVIIRANQRANVWIFNCLGTRNPPNTGAGPAAGLPGANGATAALLGLAWPLLGLAALGLRRRRLV